MEDKKEEMLEFAKFLEGVDELLVELVKQYMEQPTTDFLSNIYVFGYKESDKSTHISSHEIEEAITPKALEHMGKGYYTNNKELLPIMVFIGLGCEFERETRKAIAESDPMFPLKDLKIKGEGVAVMGMSVDKKNISVLIPIRRTPSGHIFIRKEDAIMANTDVKAAGADDDVVEGESFDMRPFFHGWAKASGNAHA